MADHESGNGRQDKPSAATLMYRLAVDKKIELFHTEDRKTYAVVPVKKHKEVWALESEQFKTWLADEFIEAYEKAAGSAAIKDAVNALIGRARKSGKPKKVHLRTAKDGDTICIFLADETWQKVCICDEDWGIVTEASVYFTRGQGMLPLPKPTKGGTVDSLRRYLNLASEQDWLLYLAWLTSCFRPTGPYPVLVVTGPQGAAKTSFMRLTRRCIDPNVAPVRQEPKSVQDVVVDALHSWIVAYDNLSKLDQSLSDCLCCLATGSGYAARKLFSDTELMVLEAQRPCIIGSIEEIVSKADLLSRTLFVRLEEIPPDKRLTEEQLHSAFEQELSLILGALLDLVTRALKEKPKVTLKEKPRMADFAVWGEAIARALGLEQGTFMQAYKANQLSGQRYILEDSVLTKPLLTLMAGKEYWHGTATELLQDLAFAGGENVDKKIWPKKSSVLGNMLRRIQTLLPLVGLTVEFDRTSDERGITIYSTGAKLPSSPSSPSLYS